MTEQNGVCGFIDDGYTRDGYIAATPYCPAIEFTYRPVLDESRIVLIDHINTADSKSKALAGQKMLASHLKSWDLKDSAGEVVEINEANMRRVEPNTLLKLRNIVMGLDVSDDRPGDDATADERREALEQAMRGEIPTQQETDAKNSVKG